jgi:hypothetical protein
MDNMFGVKRVNGEYISKKEYDKNRQKRRAEILDGWVEKQESFEGKQVRIRKIDSFSLADTLQNIDKKFCTNTEEFVGKHTDCITIKKFDKEKKAIFDNGLNVYYAGRDVVRNFILERSNLLIKKNALYVPKCKNENDVCRWFEENCNNLCLEIATHRTNSSKFHIKGSGSYGGIDHICRFIDGASDQCGFHYCKDNNYRPFLNRYMSEKQRMIYNQFYEFIEADFMLIELEYLSSHFVTHKHPSVIDMVICYKKDKDLSVPVLTLGMDRDTNV